MSPLLPRNYTSLTPQLPALRVGRSRDTQSLREGSIAAGSGRQSQGQLAGGGCGGGQPGVGLDTRGMVCPVLFTFSSHPTCHVHPHPTSSPARNAIVRSSLCPAVKIALKGDRNTGKSCLLNLLQGGAFQDAYDPTPEIKVSNPLPSRWLIPPATPPARDTRILARIASSAPCRTPPSSPQPPQHDAHANRGRLNGCEDVPSPALPVRGCHLCVSTALGNRPLISSVLPALFLRSATSRGSIRPPMTLSRWRCGTLLTWERGRRPTRPRG